MKVLLDTNFLIYASKYKIAHGLEQPLFVPQEVMEELENIAKGKIKKSVADKAAAELALALIKKWQEEKKLEILKKTAEKNTDEAIITIVKKQKFIVGTLDRELEKKLKKEGIKVLKIRQKKYFILD
jgi:rRNA-processing protein FCF1